MNFSKLRGRMAEKGYNITTLAQVIGMTRESLAYKISGKRDFKTREFDRIVGVLGLTADEVSEIYRPGS